MKLFPRSIYLLGLVFIASLNIFGGDSAPGWLRQAASIRPPSFEKEVSAVVLHNETQVTLENEGRMVTVENYAVKILTREGRRNAVATAFYLVSSGKVRSIEAWLIRPDGTVKEYDKKMVLDIISDPDDVYNEGRIKVIDASGDSDAGSVFGYTIISEDRPLFFQEKWFSQDDLPAMMSRYTLNLPSGWKASSVTFNHPEIKPQINGTSYTWELRNLPFVKSEPLSPSVVNLVPWVAINYSPEANSQSVSKAFADWLEVSRWTTIALRSAGHR